MYIGAPIGKLPHAGRPGADAGEIKHGEAGRGLRGRARRPSQSSDGKGEVPEEISTFSRKFRFLSCPSVWWLCRVHAAKSGTAPERREIGGAHTLLGVSLRSRHPERSGKDAWSSERQVSPIIDPREPKRASPRRR